MYGGNAECLPRDGNQQLFAGAVQRRRAAAFGNADDRTDVGAHATTITGAHAETHIQTDEHTETNTQTDEHTETDAEADEHSGADTCSNAGADTRSNAVSDAGANANAITNADANTGADANDYTGSNADCSAGNSARLAIAARDAACFPDAAAGNARAVAVSDLRSAIDHRHLRRAIPWSGNFFRRERFVECAHFIHTK